MAHRPTIEAGRLVLRPFTLEDANAVARLADDPGIAAMTLLIPHPYRPDHAVDWIRRHEPDFDSGRSLDLAVTRQDDGELLGAVGLTFEPDHNRACLGFWIGRPFWGRGYCTWAAAAVSRFAFETLGQHRVHSFHFVGNTPSGRVLEKIGMRREGLARQHVRKGDRYLDCVLYGMLQEDLRTPDHSPPQPFNKANRA